MSRGFDADDFRGSGFDSSRDVNRGSSPGWNSGDSLAEIHHEEEHPIVWTYGHGAIPRPYQAIEFLITVYSYLSPCMSINSEVVCRTRRSLNEHTGTSADPLLLDCQYGMYGSTKSHSHRGRLWRTETSYVDCLRRQKC